MITSAYGQHMMPFLRDEINGKAVDLENSMISYRYGFTPRVAWVPERVWCENPDNDGNGVTASGNVIDWIGDDFADNGIWAVILDDYIHCGYNNNAFNDHHIYTYGGIKVLPIDNTFVGDVNWNWGNAWNRILASTSDEIIIYGNDAEIAAEVSQGAGNPDALNNYIHILQQCSANSGTVSVWKLTDVLQDPGFTTQALTLQSGTYGLLGGLGRLRRRQQLLVRRLGGLRRRREPGRPHAEVELRPAVEQRAEQAPHRAGEQPERDGVVHPGDQPPRDRLARRRRDLRVAEPLFEPHSFREPAHRGRALGGRTLRHSTGAY